MVFAPSGRQFVIRHGESEATVVEVGGGLRTFRMGGRDILDGYGSGEMCSGGRGQVLIPWPNRIQDGRYCFRGEELQLPLTEPKLHNASHGLVRWANWRGEEVAEGGVTMHYRLHPQPGYPWALDISIRYELNDGGLAVTTQAANIGTTACPFGAGMHPYLSAGGDPIDDAILTIPARTALETNDQQIPIGTAEVKGTELDFREPRMIDDVVLDTAYTSLERDDQGRAWTTLSSGQGGWSTRLWVDRAHGFLMVFTGDTLSPERRRRGVAIEPMTCAPNAFNTGEGVLTLEPGASVEFSWGIVAD